MSKLKISLLVLISAIASGCSGPTTSEAVPITVANDPQDSSPSGIAQRVVAEHLGLSAADVALVTIEAKDFSNSSLGCPVAGRSYLQVITPGHQAIVEARGERYDVRVGRGNGRICEPAKIAR